MLANGQVPSPQCRAKASAKELAFDFMDVRYPVQVKQREKVGRPDIDALEAVMMREERTKVFFVSFAYSGDVIKEIDAFFRRTGR